MKSMHYKTIREIKSRGMDKMAKMELRVEGSMDEVVDQMKNMTNGLISARLGMELQYRKLYRSYKVSVGWTTKYRNALAEANKALIEAGLLPIGVIGGSQAETMNAAEIEEGEQLSLMDLMKGLYNE